jgi:hypothetical protein
LENLIIWLRYLDTKKIKGEIFEDLVNVVLEENEENMVIGSN